MIEINEGDFVKTKGSQIIGIVTGFHSLYDETYATIIFLTDTSYADLGYQAEYEINNILLCTELEGWQKAQLLYSLKKARHLLKSIEGILEKFGVTENET